MDLLYLFEDVPIQDETPQIDGRGVAKISRSHDVSSTECWLHSESPMRLQRPRLFACQPRVESIAQPVAKHVKGKHD